MSVDAAPTALAASAPAAADSLVADADDDTANYALIAAAGGAGLAVVFMIGRAVGGGALSPSAVRFASIDRVEEQTGDADELAHPVEA